MKHPARLLAALFATLISLLPLVAGAQDPAFSRGKTNVEDPLRVYATAVPHHLSPGFPYPFALTPSLDISLVDTGMGTRSVGSVGFGPDALFEFYNIGWRTWPKFYVGSPGSTPTPSDSNAGTIVAPVATIAKATQLCNAAGRGIVMGGTGCYPRQNNWTLNGSAGNANAPSVPIAYLAYNGPVEVGSFDFATTAAWNTTPDATFTNTYTVTRNGAERVLDTTRRDRFGKYFEFRFVATPAICNRTPDSWTFSGATVYLNRADGAIPNAGTANGTIAPTGRNTIILVNTEEFNVAYNLANPQPNIYIGTVSGSFSAANYTPSSWAILGGATLPTYGTVSVLNTDSTQAVNRCLIVAGASLEFAGGYNSGFNGSRNGASVTGMRGVAAYWRTLARGAGGDGFNLHEGDGVGGTMPFASQCLQLTVNCAGIDLGRSGSQSDQAFTNHDGSVMLDVAGYSWEAHGGSVASIGVSASLMTYGTLIGTLIHDDLGDAVLGYSRGPTAILANDYTAYWLDSVKIEMPQGTTAIASGTGSMVHTKGVWPFVGSTGGPGVIDTAYDAPRTSTEILGDRYADVRK